MNAVNSKTEKCQLTWYKPEGWINQEVVKRDREVRQERADKRR